MSFEDAPRCIFWESTSTRGDVIKTSISVSIENLFDLRRLPHVVVDNSEYSLFSLPHEIEPDEILSALYSCLESILSDAIKGSVQDEYSMNM